MRRRVLLPLVFPLALALSGCAGDGSSTPEGGTPTAPTPTAPTYQITGSVRDASALIPIYGVTLSAMDGPNAGKAATTASDGRYTLGNLQTGTFTVRTQHPNYEDHVQEVRLTASTSIDMRLIPKRTVNSGWSRGQIFYTLENGERIGARVDSSSVQQAGTTVSGTFVTADGGGGSFTGQVAGTTFSGSMRADVVFGTPPKKCSGLAPIAGGEASGTNVRITASLMGLTTCAGSVSNVELTLQP